MNESADFVMYWWDRAAELLGARMSPLRRFGLVTTNSISQVFQRRVMERHLVAKNPVSLIFAIPDHPWTKATKDSAAVRIAMTVCEAGKKDGVSHETVAEEGLDTDEPKITLTRRGGSINSDLTIGVDVTRVVPLLANARLSLRGMTYMGAGFILTPSEAHRFRNLGRQYASVIRPYISGRDMVSRIRGVSAIDLFGWKAEDVRKLMPEIYQHLILTVKPVRDSDNRNSYRENWWIFAEPRQELRNSVSELFRFIATSQTSKHRIFQFLDKDWLPDQTLVVIALSNAFVLSVVSSRIHVAWSLQSGGWLGIGNDPRYSNSRTFDPFPFPDPPEALRQKLRDAGEELDALRKKVLGEHPDLTLTGLYNVLEKLKAGAELSEKDEDVKDRGLVLILKELHETIDRLTAEAYGWPNDLSDEQILERLVALNAERAREEAEGHVRWLRPDYQIPRFARGAQARTGELDLGEKVVAIDKGLPPWPKDRYEQPLAVEMVLAGSAAPMDAATIARAFKGGGKKIEQRVGQVLMTLARYGRATALADGKFAARRAA